MTPLAYFIYFISLHSSLSPHFREECRPFPLAGMPGKPASGTLCPSLFYSRVLNQVTKANASMALGQLEVAWSHGIWCSQLSCQHLDDEFILTRTCQAQRNPGLPQNMCLQYATCTKPLVQGGNLLLYLCLKILLITYSQSYSFLVSQRQMQQGEYRI